MKPKKSEGGGLVNAPVKLATKFVKALLAIALWAPKRLFGLLFGGKKTAKSPKSLPKTSSVVSAPTEPSPDPASEKKLLDAIALKERNAKYQAIQDTMSTGNLILERMNGKPLATAPATVSTPAAPSPVAVVLPAPTVVAAEPIAPKSTVPPPASASVPISKPTVAVAAAAPISKLPVAVAAAISTPPVAVAAAAPLALSSENVPLSLEAQQAVLVVAAVGIAIATSAMTQH